MGIFGIELRKSIHKILTEDESAKLAVMLERQAASKRELADQIKDDCIVQPFGKIYSKSALDHLNNAPHVSSEHREAARLRQALFDHAREREIHDFNGLQAAVYLATGRETGLSKFSQTFEFINSAGSKVPMRWTHVVDLARALVAKKACECGMRKDPARCLCLEFAFDRLNAAIKYERVSEIRPLIEGPVTAQNARDRTFAIADIKNEFAAKATDRAPAANPPPTRWQG